MRLTFLFSSLFLLAGCAAVPIGGPDTARLQPGQLGTGGDPDVTAVNLAQYAFANRPHLWPARRRGAGGRGDGLHRGRDEHQPALVQHLGGDAGQLLQAREEVRAALAVAPGAPSQAVVDRLAAAAGALAANDEKAALAQFGPAGVHGSARAGAGRLSNMPYLRMANVSTMRAANEMFEPNDERGPAVEYSTR